MIDPKLRELIRNLVYDAQILENEASDGQGFNLVYFAKCEARIEQINDRMREIRLETRRL